MNQSDKPKRPLGLGGYAATMGLTVLVALLTGIVVGIFGETSGPLALAATIAMIAAAIAVGCAACLWWWRGIDEAAREAHKWAWWWGGSGGMVVGAVVLLSLARDKAWPLSAGVGPDPADIFAAGMTTILLFQLAGYALAWAGWWLKHR